MPILVLVCISGCGTLANGRGWGQDATLFPSAKRISKAAFNSLKDPDTWVPAAGAAVFWIGEWDEKVSDWASENALVFGSSDNAGRASDYLHATVIAGAVGSALVAPSGEDPKTWTVSKMKGLSVEAAAFWATSRATQGLKDWTRRERPNRESDESFPSMHSSHAFSFAKLGIRNIESVPMSHRERMFYAVGFRTTAGLTAWARVENQAHFPSDVLAGAALGSFLSRFIHDAFLGLDADETIRLSLEPVNKGLLYTIHIQF